MAINEKLWLKMDDPNGNKNVRVNEVKINSI